MKIIGVMNSLIAAEQTAAMIRLRQVASAYAMHCSALTRQHAADLEWAIAEIERLRADFAKAADRIAAQSELLAKRAEK